MHLRQSGIGGPLFNLLMQYSSWDVGRGAVALSRLFEYTDPEIQANFKNDDAILFDELKQLPCLFMQEGIGNQLARVGTITRTRILGKNVIIDYRYESDILPILNSTIYANKIHFDMTNEFEFGRGHWAVKDVDLYRVLLRTSQTRRQRPNVFTIPEHENLEPTLISVMMPFDAGFTSVYSDLKATAERLDLHCRRADDIWENPAIIQDIVSLIDRSRVVICDCTGRNPNVFYEIGIAHTLGREVVLITQNAADIPFDLRHLRYVLYLNNVEGRKKLCENLEARLKALLSDR